MEEDYPKPKDPRRSTREQAEAEPCNMAMRENARHLIDRRTKELRQKAEYLDILRRYLPAEMPAELEQAVYEIISDLRR